MRVTTARKSRHRLLARGLAVGLTAALAVAVTPGASADDKDEDRDRDRNERACERATNNTYKKLLGCVTLEGVREHQAGLQEAADENTDEFYPGTRAAGTSG